MFGSKWMEWIKSGAFLSLLFILFILCLGARVTGIVEHEILGLILCLLLFIHACRHARWFFAFKDGKWGIRRILSTLTNWLLALGFLLLLITGIMLSPDLFAFLGIESSMTSRQLHSGVAFWLLVLIAVHMGLHGLMIQRKVENHFGMSALLPMAALTLVIGAIGFILFFTPPLALRWPSLYIKQSPQSGLKAQLHLSVPIFSTNPLAFDSFGRLKCAAFFDNFFPKRLKEYFCNQSFGAYSRPCDDTAYTKYRLKG